MVGNKNSLWAALIIVLVAALTFFPMLGNIPLFDWDEVNFAECAREMIVSGDYSHVQLNFRPFWEKPPVFIWMQAISMNIFGVNEFAARFPNALCSIVTYLCLFFTGRKIHSQQMGITWVLLYFGSLLPHFYFKTGIIDPWFNLFIFLALYQLFVFLNNPDSPRQLVNAAGAGIFLGLAVLTKGPAALVIAATTVLGYLSWTKQLKLLAGKGSLIFVLTTLLVSASWFLIEWAKGNGNIIRQFIDYQLRLAETRDSGHGGPFYYHFLVLLIGCFPASVIFLQALFASRDLTPFHKNLRRYMLALFWTVLLIFSFVETKIVHYSSLCYFPLTFVAALYLNRDGGTFELTKTLRIIFWSVAGLITAASVIIGLGKWLVPMLAEKELIGDVFALENLKAPVQWSGLEFLLGAFVPLSALFMMRGLRENNMRKISAGLLLSGAFTTLTINIIAPKAELYTQRAAIEFYKSCAKVKCYVETHGFKSYAYLFYSNRLPSDYSNPDQQQFIETNLDQMEQEGHSRITSYAVSNQLWMEYGRIDRPAFLVVKKHQEHEQRAIPGCKKLYEQNGFVFFVRMPEDQQVSR